MLLGSCLIDPDFHYSPAYIRTCLQPDNVMLSARGRVQIADFGLSVHNVQLDNGGSASCDRTGTPGYMVRSPLIVFET